MAYNVTSEWDDIHRKIGNYEPLPEVKPQSEFIEDNINQLEDLTNPERQVKTNECSDDEDDEFFMEYRRKRLEEMDTGQTNTKKTIASLQEITSQDYLREVNNAGEGVCVLLSFYQPHVPVSLEFVKTMTELSSQVSSVKCLKTIATKCVNNFQDSNLPFMLYYRNGEMIKSFGPAHLLKVRESTEKLARFLGAKDIPEFSEWVKERKTWKDLYLEKMGNGNKRKESFSSEEDEREDRQYTSNRIFIKY